MIILYFKSFFFRCTSDKVAPYAILKHATMFNATTSNAGVPDPPVYQQKLSATTKQKTTKLKRKKQSTSQQSWAPQPVLPALTTAQPNGLMSCTTTLFHTKSKRINQSTRFQATVRSTADPYTKTATTHTKPIATTPKKITLNKRKSITQRPNITVQTKFAKRSKPLTSNLTSDTPRGDRFRLKLKDGKKDSASLHNSVSPNFVTVSLASKRPKMKTFYKGIAQTKKETHSSRKNKSRAMSSKSPPKSTSASEMNHKSSEISKLPTIWNISASETFKPTGKTLFI